MMFSGKLFDKVRGKIVKNKIFEKLEHHHTFWFKNDRPFIVQTFN